ncbi:hypothetical protein [Psychromicrobium sp. YIM B11713]
MIYDASGLKVRTGGRAVRHEFLRRSGEDDAMFSAACERVLCVRY